MDSLENKTIVLLKPYKAKKKNGYFPPTKVSGTYKFLCDKTIASNIEFYGSVAVLLKDKTIFGFPMKFVGEERANTYNTTGLKEICDIMGIAEGYFVETSLNLDYLMHYNNKMIEDNFPTLRAVYGDILKTAPSFM